MQLRSLSNFPRLAGAARRKPHARRAVPAARECRSAGFTLIETVAIITVLAVSAATAAMAIGPAKTRMLAAPSQLAEQAAVQGCMSEVVARQEWLADNESTEELNKQGAGLCSGITPAVTVAVSDAAPSISGGASLSGHYRKAVVSCGNAELTHVFSASN